jgi:ABC-type multidrug transport system fused ATPase/permease subunit
MLTTLTEGVGIAVFLSYVQWLGAPGQPPPQVVRWIQDQLAHFGGSTTVVGVMSVLVGLFLARGVLLLFQNSFHYRLVMLMQRELSGRLLRAMRNLDYLTFLKRDTGTLVHLATKEAERSVTAFYQTAFLIPKFLTVAIYAALSLRFEWRFTLLAIGMGGALVLIYRRITHSTEFLARSISASESRYQSLLIQWIQSFKYFVATHGIEPLHARALSEANTLSSLGRRIGSMSALIPASSESLIVIMLAIGMTVQTQVFKGDWASIAVTILFLYRMLRELMVVQGSLQVFGAVSPGVDRLEEYLAESESRARVDTSVGQVGRAQGRPVEVSLEKIGFRYDTTWVLREIDAQIEPAQVIALVGESGAGKSTLVDLVLGVLTPTEGAIRIPEGARIGYVPQESVLFDATIRENVSLWTSVVNRTKDDAELWAALRSAGAEDFVRALPQGLETPIGERGVRLSGGQRQRLSIARELYRKPDLLVMDEATSALDAESEHVIQTSLKSLKGKVTVILIAHRLATVREADQILVLDQGRVVQRGSFETLAQQEGRFRRLVELQDLRVGARGANP